MKTVCNIISADFIRSITNISNNLQDKFLISAIREAQDMDFQQVVGQELYHKLTQLISADKVEEPENIYYKELLDISSYFLAYSVVARVVVISSIKLDNMGATQTNDDNINSLSINDVFKMEKHYQNKADYYKKRVQDYLIANDEHFPELWKNGCHEVHNNLYSAASSGIFVGGERGCKHGNRHGNLSDKYEYKH